MMGKVYLVYITPGQWECMKSAFLQSLIFSIFLDLQDQRLGLCPSSALFLLWFLLSVVRWHHNPNCRKTFRWRLKLMMSPRGPTQQWSHDNQEGQVREMVPVKFLRQYLPGSGNAPLACLSCYEIMCVIWFFCEFSCPNINICLVLIKHKVSLL